MKKPIELIDQEFIQRPTDGMGTAGKPKPIDLEAIRARNEERKNPQAHREGCFSSVAYDESAFGTCGCYDALAEIAPDDIDALLAEVERLSKGRYAVFSAPTYYPAGGWADLAARYDTAQEAIEHVAKDYDADAIDLLTGETLR